MQKYYGFYFDCFVIGALVPFPFYDWRFYGVQVPVVFLSAMIHSWSAR